MVSRQWPEEIANHLALNAIHRLSDQSVGHVKPLFLWLARPEVLDEIVEHSVGRALDLFGLDSGKVRRWGEDVGPGAPP